MENAPPQSGKYPRGTTLALPVELRKSLFVDPTELESVTFAMSMQRSNQTELRIQLDELILPKLASSNNL